MGLLHPIQTIKKGLNKVHSFIISYQEKIAINLIEQKVVSKTIKLLKQEIINLNQRGKIFSEASKNSEIILNYIYKDGDLGNLSPSLKIAVAKTKVILTKEVNSYIEVILNDIELKKQSNSERLEENIKIIKQAFAKGEISEEKQNKLIESITKELNELNKKMDEYSDSVNNLDLYQLLCHKLEMEQKQI